MAVLETIRVKFGVLITVLIAVALLSFIIDPSTLESVSSTMSSKYDVGEIDGKSISYTDYQADVDKFATVHEVMTGSSAQNEEQQKGIQDAAWQSLIDKYLFIKNANRAGVYVGDEEAKDLIAGDHVSPFMAQFFTDENGNFRKDAFLDFRDQCNSDPSGRMKNVLNFMSQTVITQQYYAKYLALFTASNVQNELQLNRTIAENNTTTDAEFVVVPFGFVQDSSIVVSDKEIKEYYNAHKKFYKQNASRDIEYVVFEVEPSETDLAAANSLIAAHYDEFRNTENIKSFLLGNSDRRYDETYYKAGELNAVAPEVNDFVFDAKSGKGAVSQVLQRNETFYAVRVLDTKTENGVVSKQVAIFEKTAVPSKETVGAEYTKANAFAVQAAGSYKNFLAAVDSQAVYAHPVNNLTEGASRIGSIDNAKEVSRWAFEAKKGAVSGIITINNAYFIIATLKDIHKEGYMKVSEVAPSIKMALYADKEADKVKAEVAAKIDGLTDMNAIAEALGTTVSTKTGIAFSSMTSQGLDPAFIGAVSVAEEGKISGPVAGNIGVYVFKVTGRETGAFYTEDDAVTRQNQMNQYLAQMILPTMMENVKDNRARFY